MRSHVRWLGHASFCIKVPGFPRIYVDLWRLGENPLPADLMLVTHHHHDHCSSDDVAQIRQEETVIVVNPSAAKKLREELGKKAVQHVMEAR